MRSRSTLVAFLVAIALLLSACNLPAPAGQPTGTPSQAVTQTTPPASIPSGPTAAVSGPPIGHIPVGQGISIVQVHMFDALNGWGIGGLDQADDHVFTTADGGNTWRDVTPPQPQPPAGVQSDAVGWFLDTATAWVAYESRISVSPAAYVWFTRDGGLTWQRSQLDTSMASDLFAPQFIDFVNPNRGWILVDLGVGLGHSYVALFSTLDGGLTWTVLATPQGSTAIEIQACPKTALVFSDVLNGWISRECRGLMPSPAILHTADGGSTWTSIEFLPPLSAPDLFATYACDMASPMPFSITSIMMLMQCKGITDPASEQDYLYTSIDGGLTWSSSPMPADYVMGPAGAIFFDPLDGIAFGRRIYKTADGGVSWSLVQTVTWDGQFSFINANKGWAAVVNDSQLNALVVTDNGGAKWDLLNPLAVP